VTTEEDVRQKFSRLKGSMDERMTRLWAGAEADAMGYGGIAAVARATGLAIRTVTAGRNELRAGASTDGIVKVRRKGGGRRLHEVVHPELIPLLQALVAPATRGDPESALLWTNKSTHALSAEMFDTHNIRVGDKTIARLLREMGYSLQATQKTVEGAQHPDRDAQFEHINAKAMECIERGIPFVSVDTKKKELVGNFKNAGREWHLKGSPERSDVHDFPDQGLGKAIPYGVLDVADNSAFVVVGSDHDTPRFAATSFETWWLRMGKKRYPDARAIHVTADSGGSNSARSRIWKVQLQKFADKYGITVSVSHFPPGTSKWNKIEHRLFSFITINWRGRPLRTFETVVSLIGATTTRTGLVVKATLDGRKYPLGEEVSDAEMKSLNIVRDSFHGDWNYTIGPRDKAR